MIAVDTNVVIRLLMRDDETQYAQSLALFKTKSIFLCDTVILEAEWVLRCSYLFRPTEVNKLLSWLIGLPNVQVADANRLTRTLQWHIDGLDFADAFHLACYQQCSILYTFDKKFIRRGQPLTKIRILEPS